LVASIESIAVMGNSVGMLVRVRLVNALKRYMLRHIVGGARGPGMMVSRENQLRDVGGFEVPTHGRI
jgi:hypothetical protein